MNKYKSRCRTCGEVPRWASGAYMNHFWDGECLTVGYGYSYIPSDNLEYLEWKSEQTPYSFKNK